MEVKLIRFVGAYSDPARDPRGHCVSIAYLAEAVSGELKAATDAEEARVFKGKPEGLAFDHGKIYEDAIRG